MYLLKPDCIRINEAPSNQIPKNSGVFVSIKFHLLTVFTVAGYGMFNAPFPVANIGRNADLTIAFRAKWQVIVGHFLPLIINAKAS